MKNILILTLALISNLSFAHQIIGTPVLKGSLKTKITVNGVKSTCKVKIDDVKNLMEEDSFGNPAYKVKVIISLGGHDFDTGRSVSFDKKTVLTNLFPTETGSIVKDLEYSDESVFLNIHPDGRLNFMRFPIANQIITCSF